MKRKSPEPQLDEIIPLLIGIWRRILKESGPLDRLQTREFRQVVAAVEKMQKGELPEDYFSDPYTLGAFLLYRWVIFYLQGLSLIGELPRVPRRVLDLCSGPGAAFAFAALRHGASDVYATDRNMRALELGAEVCGRYGYPLNLRRWDCLQSAMPIEGKFDLIIAGHCLEDLFPSSVKGWKERQHAFISKLLGRLNPTGYLLIVDSSFPEPNRRVLQLRDDLVNEGVAVQAPCVWRGPCPALQVANSPCYAQREFEKPFLIKEIQRAASINLSSLKMSYIIFRSPAADWPTLEDKNYYRVISPPVDSYQGKRYYLCGTDGKKVLGSNLQELPKEARAYDYLRRGELISFEDALEKGNAIDIVKGTKVIVDAACGKPIPEKDEG